MPPSKSSTVANLQVLCSLIGTLAVLGGVIFAAGDRNGALSGYQEQAKQARTEIDQVKTEVRDLKDSIKALEIGDAKTQKDLGYIVEWVREQKATPTRTASTP